MAKNLRTFIAEVAEKFPGAMYEIARQVDPKFELTAFVAKFAARGEFPGLLFKDVADARFPCVINLMASYDRVALAFGCEPTQIGEFFGTRLAEKVSPHVVSRNAAPVKDVVVREGDVDLGVLPLPWHNELDGGAFITGGTMIARDRETGAYNAGIYRHQLFGPRELGVVFNKTHDGGYIYQQYEERGESVPVAIAIGHHPAYLMACVSRLPGVGGEFEAAGSLLGEPLELVGCETNDLLVPAQAELIIEGSMVPRERHAEGPFGEWPGHYLGDEKSYVMRVTAITHRRDAIFQAIMPSAREHVLMGAVPRIGSIFRAVKAVVPSVRSVNCPAHSRMHCYISLTRRHNVDVKRAAFAALNTEPDNLRGVIVVDDDVNIFEDGDLMWALGTRFDAERDLTVVRDWSGPGGVLPQNWVYHLDGTRTARTSSVFIMDATKPPPPVPYPPRSAVPAAAVEAVDLRDATPMREPLKKDAEIF